MSNEWNKANPDRVRAARIRYRSTERGRAKNREAAALFQARAIKAAHLAGVPYNQFRHWPLAIRKSFMEQIQE